MSLAKKITLILSFFLYINAYSQIEEYNPQTLVEPNPEAYSLGKYGFIPANKYNGRVPVTIPLHHILFEDLKLPITLSYNSGGLKVQEEASWVGLGWSLTSNAIITRSVRSVDDLLKKYGWIYQSELTDVMPHQYYVLPLSDATLQDIKHSFGNTNALPDTEQDIYVVNLFGETLRFIVNKKPVDSNIINCTVLNNLTYQVSFNVQTEEFTITNGIGYKYHFDVLSHSKSSNMCSQNSPEIITSWYLNKIEAPTGREILFYYRTPVRTTKLDVIEKEVDYYCFENNSRARPLISRSCNVFLENESIYLDSIGNGMEKIVFHTSDRTDLTPTNENSKGQKLDSIHVKYGRDIKKSLIFNTSYFNANKTEEEFLRLKLDSLKENNKVYKFEYNNPNNLPSKMSRSMDYWGYYNGKNHAKLNPPYKGKADCVPDISLPAIVTKEISIDGSYREADPTYSKKGVLNKVIYPTGGYSEFEYEGHEVKLNYGKFYHWEAPPDYEEIEMDNQSAGNTVSYSFTIDKPLEFSVGDYVDTQLKLTINKIIPHNIYNVIYAYRDSIAIEITRNDQSIYTLKYQDYLDYCYTCSDCHSCSNKCLSSSNGVDCPYCYCFNSVDYFTDTLSPGTYTINLYVQDSMRAGFSLRLPPENTDHRNKLVGGIRIKSIKDYDTYGTLASHKEFDYTEQASEYSAGRLMNKPSFIKHYAFEYSVTSHDTGGGHLPPDIYMARTFYTISSSRPNAPFSNSTKGLHIGYDYVKEKFISNDEINNYTIGTTYKNYSSGITHFHLMQNANPSGGGILLLSTDGGQVSFRENNGLIIDEYYFNNVGDTVKSISNTYKKLIYNDEAPFKNLSVKLMLGQGTQRVDAFQNYYNHREKHVLKSRTEIDHTKNGKVVKTKNYKYNNLWLTKEESFRNSQNQLHQNKHYYPIDYTSQSHLINNNIVSKALKSVAIVDGKLQDGSVKELNIRGKETKIYRYESPTPLDTLPHNPTTLIPTSYFLKHEMNYSNGRVREYKPVSGIPITYLWGYDQKYVVAKIEGLTYNEFSSLCTYDQSLLNNPYDEASLLNELNSIRNTLSNSPNVQVTTYTYDPLEGMTSQTDPNGITIYYEYDNFNRLKLTRDHENNILQQYTYQYANPESAATQNQVNHIYQYAPQKAITNETSIATSHINDVTKSATYFDGLGRGLQTVIKQGSPSGDDIVTPMVYDEFGRQSINYLPYVQTGQSSGNYVPDPVGKQSGSYSGSPHHTFYNTTNKVAHDDRPFHETVFEPSPLNRPIQQYGPGKNWKDNDRAIAHSYEVNTANEVLMWSVDDTTGKPTKGSPQEYYEAGKLHKKVTTDEDGHQVIEFVDKQGRTVLKRIQAHEKGVPIADEKWADTYYIYDDFGNLRFVLPPEAVANLSGYGQ